MPMKGSGLRPCGAAAKQEGPPPNREAALPLSTAVASDRYEASLSRR